MKKYFFLILIVLGLGAQAAPKPKASPARSRPQPQTPVTPPGAAPAASPALVSTSAASVTESAEAVGGKTGDSLDVTITGEAKDEIPVVIDPPPLDIEFKDIVGLSRDGQTERVVNGPVEVIKGGELMAMALLEPRQVAGSLPVKIPGPPFIQMEIATGLEPSRWDFRVLDENNRVVYRQESSADLRDLLVWEGMDNSTPKILAGQVYTPMLITIGKAGKTDRFYGEPVLLDVLQYDQGGDRMIEFFNERLFDQGSADIPLDMAPPLKALLGMLRRYAGAPVRVVVHFTPEDRDVAQARIDALKNLLTDALLAEPAALSFSAAPAGGRGDVTEFVIPGAAR